jgi:coproporphyrinogen III oxidase-like Fe-S oxidoreductase
MALQQGVLPVEDEEVPGEDSHALERVWLGLRTAEGIPLSGTSPHQQELAAQWQHRGWASVSGPVIRLTPEGWLLLDRLALEFAEAHPVLASCS